MGWCPGAPFDARGDIYSLREIPIIDDYVFRICPSD